MRVPGYEADAFVIGGGPAGLAAAIAARKKGLSVVVADGAEPPIDKPCGEGLMPETQRALEALGVEVPVGSGYRFRGIGFVEGHLRVAADFPTGPGIGIRRPILHELLLREAERLGVTFLWKTAVRGLGADGVHLAAKTVRARWIIGADGSGSRVRRWSRLECSVERQRRFASRRHYCVRPWAEYAEIYWGPRSQAYVTPISRDQVCIVVMAERPEHANFDQAWKHWPELRERLSGAELGSRERGAVTAMHSLRRVCQGNLALIGDASGSVDAIAGEGLRLAFRQALSLASAMASGTLQTYQNEHRKLRQRPFWMGKLLLQLGRNSEMRKRVLRMMQHRPELFARLLALHLGYAKPEEVLWTTAQLGWRFLAA